MKLFSLLCFALISCSYEEEYDFISDYGIEVFIRPEAKVNKLLLTAAEEGTLAGVEWVFGEDSKIIVEEYLRENTSLVAMPGYKFKCGELWAVGCASSGNIRIATRNPWRCFERVVAHELSHVVGTALNINNDHDNELLFGLWSVAFFAEGHVEAVCEGEELE